MILDYYLSDSELQTLALSFLFIHFLNKVQSVNINIIITEMVWKVYIP
jgi:hypothetical protein